jgi:hypothetical protein
MQKELDIQGHQYLLCCNKKNLQLDVIYQYLKNSYWSKGIPKALVERGIDNSLCFALYHLNTQSEAPNMYDPDTNANANANANAKHENHMRQIGFARVITDKSSFAYLADVFILPGYSKQGLGSALIDFVMQHNDLQGLRRFMLCTRDAHSLYKKFGFTEVEEPQMMMQISEKSPYLAT